MTRFAFIFFLLPYLFSVTAHADELLTRELPDQDLITQSLGPLYDLSAKLHGPQALINWKPDKITSGYSTRSQSVTVLKSLIVEVKGPTTVTRIEELILTTTITNTGSETLRLIREPSGVLYSHLPTKRFHVTHSTGVIPQFKGVKVKFSLKEAIKSGHVASLGPGESILVQHDVSKTYDFTVSGFGRYNFEPRNRFIVVNPATQKATVVRAASTRGTSVDWSGRLVARGAAQSSQSSQRSIKCIECSQEQQNVVTGIVAIVEAMMNDVLTYFKPGFKGPDKDPFIKCFGGSPLYKTNWEKAHSRFQNMATLHVTFKCHPESNQPIVPVDNTHFHWTGQPHNPEDDLLATMGNSPGEVILHKGFFGDKKSKIEKAGSIIHVLSQFVGANEAEFQYSHVMWLLGDGYKHMQNGKRQEWLARAVNMPDAYQHFAMRFIENVPK